MSNWAALAEKMDAIVDKRLADTVSYAVSPAAAVNLDGFIIFPEAVPGLDGIDELVARPQLKIAKRLVAAPKKADRISCVARLGAGLWQPSAKQPQTQGRYWIIDIQKVSA